MQCTLTGCEWNGFGSCCPESQVMQQVVTPNLETCPHYLDIRDEAEREKFKYAQWLVELLLDMKFPYAEQVCKRLFEMSAEELLREGKRIERLHESYLANKAIEEIFAEIERLGVEEFKNRYVFAFGE